jgi:hypothetical protein
MYIQIHIYIYREYARRTLTRLPADSDDEGDKW